MVTATPCYLSGQRLIWAVHKIVAGKALDVRSADWQRVLKTHNYITDWGKAGPLIDRYRLTVEYKGPKDWYACAPEHDATVCGPTALVALARCIVDLHADGEAIQVPEELPE